MEWEVGGLKSGSPVLEFVLEYRNAVLEYCRVVIVLGIDLRLPVLGLNSYLAKAVLILSLLRPSDV
jgi:hypothetical protein